MNPRLAFLLVAASGCANGLEPARTETWAADLQARGQVIVMSFDRGQTSFTGSGSLATLTVPGAEALTLTGQRRTDTLDIVFHRPSGGQFRLIGWYVLNGAVIAGTLNGDEFVNTSASFRKR